MIFSSIILLFDDYIVCVCVSTSGNKVVHSTPYLLVVEIQEEERYCCCSFRKEKSACRYLSTIRSDSGVCLLM